MKTLLFIVVAGAAIGAAVGCLAGLIITLALTAVPDKRVVELTLHRHE